MSLIKRLLEALRELLHGHKKLAPPNPPTFSTPEWSTDMSKINVPLTPPTTRTDGKPIAAGELEKMDASVSLDGGQTFNSVGSFPADKPADVVIDGVDPGTSVILHGTVTDTQKPPKTSAFATATVGVPALAAPNPPSFGTPVIS